MSVLVIGKAGWISSTLFSTQNSAEFTCIAGRSLPQDDEKKSRKTLLKMISKSQPTTVLNLYGAKTGTKEELFRINSQFPEILAGCAFEIGARFIHIGSAAEYGDKSRKLPISEDEAPGGTLSDYGESKLLGTQGLLSVNSQALVLRVFNIYGPGAPQTNLIRNFAHEIKTQIASSFSELTIRNSRTTRDFLHVSEVSRLITLLLHTEATGVVNLCSGSGVSLGDLAMEIFQRKEAGFPIEIKSLTDIEDTIVGDSTKLKKLIATESRSSYSSLPDFLIDEVFN